MLNFQITEIWKKKCFFRKRLTKTIEYFLYLEYLWQASCTSYYLGSFSEIPLCCGKLNGFPHHLSIVFQIGISKSHSESWQLRSSWIHLGHLSQPVLWSCFSHIHCLSCSLSYCIQTALLFPWSLTESTSSTRRWTNFLVEIGLSNIFQY